MDGEPGRLGLLLHDLPRMSVAVWAAVIIIIRVHVVLASSMPVPHFWGNDPRGLVRFPILALIAPNAKHRRLITNSIEGCRIALGGGRLFRCKADQPSTIFDGNRVVEMEHRLVALHELAVRVGAAIDRFLFESPLPSGLYLRTTGTLLFELFDLRA
jgi:hypothetical protein